MIREHAELDVREQFFRAMKDRFVLVQFCVVFFELFVVILRCLHEEPDSLSKLISKLLAHVLRLAEDQRLPTFTHGLL